MTALVWIVALFLVGLAVLVLEVFVPSGGVLGFLSVVAIGAAIGEAFVAGGMAWGLAVLGVSFLAVPAVLAAAFRVFPETPLGRRVLPPPPGADDVRPGAARRRRLETLVGRRGRAVGELVPWGTVEVEGDACEAVSEAGPIPPGVEVEVVGLDAAALVVRPVTVTRAPGRPDRPGASRTEQPEQPAADGRSRTLEEFDFDGLEPPAA
ncbi:MAG: NfeD family protein [Planctomycetaceae bacterium]